MPGQWHRLSPVAIGSMRRFGAGCRAWLGGATVVAKGTDEATAPLHPLSPSARPVFHAAVVAAPSLGAAAVVLAVGLPTLILPFWSDSAIFATVGKAIADGGFPYVDAWDQKP
ncbi:MAG: hypothetical protein ACRDJE_11850, partial [Dehalococcoidia bacterium]